MNQLGILWLGHTSISDAGLAHLKELPSLVSVVLDGTNVTLKGLKSLKNMNSLVLISLREVSNFSDEDEVELKSAMPNVRIIR